MKDKYIADYEFKLVFQSSSELKDRFENLSLPKEIEIGYEQGCMIFSQNQYTFIFEVDDLDVGTYKEFVNELKNITKDVSDGHVIVTRENARKDDGENLDYHIRYRYKNGVEEKVYGYWELKFPEFEDK